MTKKLFLLAKNNILMTFNPQKLFKRQNAPVSKGKTVLYGFLMLFLFGYFISMTSAVYYFLGTALKGTDFIDLLIFLPIVLYTALILIITIFSAQGYLFKSKDLPLLLSMPVSHFTVLLSKFILLYIYELLFAVVILGPAFYLYFYFTSFSVIGIISAVLCFFASPLIPISIGSLFSYLLGLVTRRMRKKNFFTIIISLILLIAWIITVQKGDAVFNYVLQNSETLQNAFSRYYFPSEWLLGGINGEILKTILFIIINIAAVIIAFSIISRKYAVIVSTLNSSGVRKKHKVQKLDEQRSSALGAMVKKELSAYFSSSNYVLNTIIGPVMLIIASIAFLFIGKESILTISQQQGFLQLDIAIASVLTIFLPSISPTTSSVISLEGKKLWIYKSIPARTKDILIAKTAVNLIITVPAIIISDILLCIALNLGIFDFITLILLGITFAALFSLTGILINLAKPKLDFDNEVVVIKQSMSIFLQMLTSMVVMLAVVIIYIAAIDINFYIYALSVLIIVWAIIAFLINRLFNWGVKRFNEL